MKAKDVRKGQTVLYKGVPHKVTEAVHRTPGNLRAFVQMKLRNVMNGIQVEDRFSSFDDLEQADMGQFKAAYLYSDDTGYHFMNTDSYEQYSLSEDLVGDQKFFLFEGLNVEIQTFEDRPIGLQLPKTVVLEVVDTAPELKGATQTNVGKPATMNTGLVVNVPPFIKVGEKLLIDTEESKYLSRADK
jgi:elongation factor P